MIKKLLLVFIAFIALKTYAQEGTASPYSFYGIGSLKMKGTVENASMGGLSIYTDSIHVNLKNPTAYVSPYLKMYNEESRPVKFSVGASHTSLNLKSSSAEEKTTTTTFDYLTLAVPISKKMGMGFGLLPYTAVGYQLESNNDNGDVANRYSGEGGVNKVFLGFGYAITDKLKAGIDVSYNFGNIQNNVIELIYDENNEPIQYQTKEENRSDLSGMSVNLALNYKTMISDKLELTAGLTYSPKSTLVSQNQRTFATIVYDSSTGSEYEVESIEADLESENLEETDLTLPSQFSFGLGLGQPRKWFAGIEYTNQSTSEFSNPIFSIDNATFVDASSLSLGGFYLPDYNSFSSYWKRAVYRAGLRFEHTGLKINGEDIREFGMSFGVGLPIGGTFSNANVGFEFGKRGTTNQNLIQENFFSLKLSLSLNDRWFQKLKYN